MESKHWTQERTGRNALINLVGEGRVFARFEVDRGHRNGPEVHTITANAIIIITNKATGKLITKLVARPEQIKRYYKNGQAPQSLIWAARKNLEKGYNEM